jgi:hypothetical protein
MKPAHYTIVNSVKQDGIWWVVIEVAGDHYGGAAGTKAEALRLAKVGAAEANPILS